MTYTLPPRLFRAVPQGTRSAVSFPVLNRAVSLRTVYSKANVEGLAALAGHQPAKHMPLSQNELLDMLDKLRQSQMLIAAVRDAYLSAGGHIEDARRHHIARWHCGLNLFFSPTCSWRQRCLRIYTGLQRNLTIYARWRISDPPPTPIKTKGFCVVADFTPQFSPSARKKSLRQSFAEIKRYRWKSPSKPSKKCPCRQASLPAYRAIRPGAYCPATA